MNRKSWLLLLYGLPSKQTTERVSLWRKLKKFGAVQLKSSSYILPDDAANFERFQWLSKQIQDGGGEATLMHVSDVEGLSDEQIIQLFVEARTNDYKDLITTARIALRHKSKPEDLAPELDRLQRRFAEIREIDHFKSHAAHDAQMVLEQIEKRLGSRKSPALPKLEPRKFNGKTWLTRPRPGIDRAGSAWLIRKFIDPKARFVFGTKRPRHGETISFDMLDADFSHHGPDCTFETLVKRFGITDKGVAQIAEMVHDADLEDGKFGRTECLGINAVLGGWAKTDISDAELLAKGIDCFEGLYLTLKK